MVRGPISLKPYVRECRVSYWAMPSRSLLNPSSEMLFASNVKLFTR